MLNARFVARPDIILIPLKNKTNINIDAVNSYAKNKQFKYFFNY